MFLYDLLAVGGIETALNVIMFNRVLMLIQTS